MHHIGLQTLRAKIRGFHVTSLTVAARIVKAKHEKKDRLYKLKREMGIHARHHLIAYGLLRGVPYERIERCAQNNRPDPNVILRILQEHNPPSWASTMHRTFDLAIVEVLLTRHVTAWEEHAAHVQRASDGASSSAECSLTAHTMAQEKAA